MKIGVVNCNIATFGILDQLLHEGHKLFLFLALPDFVVSDGMGLASKYPKQVTVVNEGDFYKKVSADNPFVQSALTKMLKCDFIFFDFLKEPDLIWIPQWFRDKGIPVIGPSEASTKIENDRTLGKQLASDNGIKQLTKSATLYSFEDAAKLAKKKKKGFLLKGNNSVTVWPLNYLDGVDLLTRPYANKFLGLPLFMEFELEDTEEIAFSFMCNGKNLHPCVLVNREYKGIFNNKQGNVLCGEAGTVAHFVDTTHVTLPEGIYEAALAAFDSISAQVSYKGMLDMNLLWSKKEKTFHFLEWTPRSGIPTEHLISALFAGKYANHLAWMAGITEKQTTPSLDWVVSTAVQYINTDADGGEIHSPLVAGVVDGVGTRPHKSKSGALVIPMCAMYDDGVLRTSPIVKDRTVIVVGKHSVFEDARRIMRNGLSEISIWSHHHRTDVASELRCQTQSLLEVLV